MKDMEYVLQYRKNKQKREQDENISIYNIEDIPKGKLEHRAATINP